MAAMTITTIDKAVLKAPDVERSTGAIVVVIVEVTAPGGRTTTTEILLTWTALMADVGAPAFERAVLKTVVNVVLNAAWSLNAESTLAVTAAAIDGGA